MATEELYEVEHIVDKRRNKKGKTEYLVRWRGYGTEEDTWEPETHLSACLVYIQEFNRQQLANHKDSPLLRSTRTTPHPATGQAPLPGHSPLMSHTPLTGHSPASNGATATSKGSATNARKHFPSQPQLPSGASAHCSSLLASDTVNVKPSSPLLLAASRHSRQGLDCREPGPLTSPSQSPVLNPGGRRPGVDLSKTGIKILVPRSPMNSRVDAEESLSEGAHSLEAGSQEAHLVPPEVALLVKPVGVLPLRPGEERARMGSRPRGHPQSLLPSSQVPITPAAMRSHNGTGASALMEASSAGGLAGSQSATVGAASASTGKRRVEERHAFDKRLRYSVRQTESAYRYRDIVVRKQDGFTHILLSTKTENNTLNPDVMKEIQSAMATAASDDSKLVLLGAVGNTFCYGLDFLYFIRRLTDDRKKESVKMAETIRAFVDTFIQFKKPIVVAVNGPAVGLGAALLPLCDVVWANEKAWFQTPYTVYGQTPDTCSSFTFPRIMGVASANEMLLSGRKLTAQEACAKGLVSQVLWPGTFSQEVMLRIKELVSVNSLVLRESKALMRSTNRSALEQANERECEALKRVWGSSQGTDSILKYLQKKLDQL
ncbi:chromodomain Y-like protein [Gadus chalcogrammus]|uniref:chromodomain Y-like protein n=1 Tax=Gadus chalcogrammus TaxID=1042646 RepID=UPI0024C48736|nr:chromodomain Y-like protein [Gadus chalcogrammus]